MGATLNFRNGKHLQSYMGIDQDFVPFLGDISYIKLII